MFSFFTKKDKKDLKNNDISFEIELTAAVLAYEVARSDGDISDSELKVLMEEIEIIANKVGKKNSEIFDLIELYSKDSVSFYEFVSDINKNYSKDEKLSLLNFMWQVAYADGNLDVEEERLIRRLAEMIKIKDIDVLKLKNISKTSIL